MTDTGVRSSCDASAMTAVVGPNITLMGWIAFCARNQRQGRYRGRLRDNAADQRLAKHGEIVIHARQCMADHDLVAAIRERQGSDAQAMTADTSAELVETRAGRICSARMAPPRRALHVHGDTAIASCGRRLISWTVLGAASCSDSPSPSRPQRHSAASASDALPRRRD